MRASNPWLALGIALLVAGCLSPPATTTAPTSAPTSSPATTPPPAPFVMGAPHLRDVTAASGIQPCPHQDAPGPGLSWGDYDNDGLPDLFVSCRSGGRLYHNEGGHFRDVTQEANATLAGEAAVSAAWGDYDNDGCLDLFVVGPTPNAAGGRLLRNTCHGRFQETTNESGIVAPPGTLGARWADVERSGHLDLLLTGRSNRLYEFANGSFLDVTRRALVPDDANHTSLDAAWADLNGDLYPDLFVARTPGPPLFLRNLGNGLFHDVAGSDRAGPVGDAWSAAVADANGDGFPDVAASGPHGAQLWQAQGDGTFVDTAAKAGLGAARGLAATWADLNNDGWDDLLVAGPGTALFLNQGHGLFRDATAESGFDVAANVTTLAVADWDRDGFPDVALALSDGGVRLLHNDGPDLPRGSWLEVRLTGNQSNRLGLGASLAVHTSAGQVVRQANDAGAWLAQDDAEAHFGLGLVGAAIPVLDIQWPSGTHQVVTEITRNVTHTFQETGSSKTSCPLLFVWDGSALRFVSDVAGDAYTGWLVAPPDVHHVPDPYELVRVDGMAPRPDGTFDVRLLETLEETDYVDQVQLVAVDHAPGLATIPDDGFQVLPPYRAFGVATLAAPHPVLGAWDGQGRNVTALVAAADRTYPPVPVLPSPRFDGYAENHSLTLDLGPDATATGHLRLSAWGWVYYPMVTPNLVVDGPYVAPRPPRLEALDPATGAWKLVSPDIGFPAGLPKWWSVDLSGKLPAGARLVRITTNLRIYYDQILVDTSPPVPVAVTRVAPLSADLHFRGYPTFASPDGRQPALYDYSRMSPVYVWKSMHGNYTRYGNVTELLTQPDDRFAVFSHGEELSMRFRPPPTRPGLERTYFLWFDLYSKDTQPHNAYPKTVEPLPFHAMTNYPYPPSEHFPDDALHRTYLATYETRTRP
ncbi:MAG: CRTAC1 family protein [Thermoplasmatota archaeon]